MFVKITRKKALESGEKWLKRILSMLYKTCYVFEPKINDEEKRDLFLQHLEQMARKSTRNFDDKGDTEKIFIMVVVAVEAAVSAIKKSLLSLCSQTKC